MRLPPARLAVLACVVLVVGVWASVGGSQSPTPGVPTPGAAPVRVVNELTTHAAQSGAWQVSLVPGTSVGLAGDTAVAVLPPDFLKLGRRYLVRPAGEQASLYTIDRVDHGWVRADGAGGARWFNLAQVVSVQEAQ